MKFIYFNLSSRPPQMAAQTLGCARHSRSKIGIARNSSHSKPNQPKVDHSTRQQTNPSPSTMPGVVLQNPQKTIQTIFSESQKSAVTHRKLVNSLRTVQLTCIQQNNEDAFNGEFIRCLNRVLPVKKSEPTADRVVKFIGHFIQHVQDKGKRVRSCDNRSGQGGR